MSEYGEYELDDPDEFAAPPPMALPSRWSWSPSMLLWVAGGITVFGFGVWFLMSYSGARARAIAGEVVTGDTV